MTKVGDIRPSQLLFTYGMGSLINLPKFSAIVLGLDHWRKELAPPITEERLLSAVRKELGDQVERLALPPVDPQKSQNRDYGHTAEGIGLPVAPFPEWMVCSRCRMMGRANSGLFEFRSHPLYTHEHKYVHVNCPKAKEPAVIPARFYVVCESGHMDDFPWQYFVHKGHNLDCKSQLQMLGMAADISTIIIKCMTCNEFRYIVEAFNKAKQVMPRCQGVHMHIGGQADECDKQMKPMTLGASNTWFPVTLSVVSIPLEIKTELEALINEHWETLKKVESIEEIKMLIKFDKLNKFFQYHDQPEAIFEAVKARQDTDKSDKDNPDKDDLLIPEYRVLSNPEKAKVTPNFKIVNEPVPQTYRDFISKVVRVERLREVRALIGFTRVDAPDRGGAEQSDRLAPLSYGKPKLVPASEVRGEGIFIVFNMEKILEWLKPKELKKYRKEFRKAHVQWRMQRRYPSPEDDFPSLAYVLIHSFSHALMRQLSLECGYNAASLKEKIYSQLPDGEHLPQAGLLIYTSSPDSEGTLGGLVELGREERLGYIIEQALENSKLCSSDPLCSEHEMISGSQVSLHAAACHACLFAPETSCERGNRYLDRSVLVSTLTSEGLNFFDNHE